MELELARAKDEAAQLKQQLAEAQGVEKERKKLSDKVDKLEAKVQALVEPVDKTASLTRAALQMDDLVKDNVAAKEAELHAIYDERLRNYEERCGIYRAIPRDLVAVVLTAVVALREKDLQRQVTVARSQLRELRTTADSSQAKLFDHSQRQGAVKEKLALGTHSYRTTHSCASQIKRQLHASLKLTSSLKISNEPIVA